RNVISKVLESAFSDLVHASLRNDETTLPVLLPVDHDEHFSGFDVSQCLAGISGEAADPHPQNIHGSAQINYLQTGALAHNGMPAVGSDGKSSANFLHPVWASCAHTNNSSILLDKVGGFGLHLDPKAGIASALLDNEVQKIPLRHERQKLAVRRK